MIENCVKLSLTSRQDSESHGLPCKLLDQNSPTLICPQAMIHQSEWKNRPFIQLKMFQGSLGLQLLQTYFFRAKTPLPLTSTI